MKLDGLMERSRRPGRAAVCLFAVAAVLAACGEREQPTAVPPGTASLAKLREVDPAANRLAEDIRRYALRG